ncbi:MAG TPA: coenzyme F420-0:L-glutamate ligase [Dehalococcoidia bacterium]|jgi:coenzyme F420-0:L-glutamate ligase/coenzyme F420-1:gamma-L-glutamate ligase|nr:coenzyme F420-0:L-glutamate ligase [Dehalococcoidia bacterium]
MSLLSPVSAIPVTGLPEFVLGDDVGRLIADQCRVNGTPLTDGDLVVVAQKIVSKAEGAIQLISEQAPTAEALQLAEEIGKDPRMVQIVLDQSARVVRAVPGVLIVETIHGFICANAGVDQSNIEADDVVTTLPEDSYRSARGIRKTLVELLGLSVGVLVSDTFNRPWREGSTNVAIGVAGFDPLRDLRGTIDDFDREMVTSMVSLADEVASTAQLVMGESGRIPAAIVRGVSWDPGDFPSDRLLRPANRDLFR